MNLRFLIFLLSLHFIVFVYLSGKHNGVGVWLANPDASLVHLFLPWTLLDPIVFATVLVSSWYFKIILANTTCLCNFQNWSFLRELTEWWFWEIVSPFFIMKRYKNPRLTKMVFLKKAFYFGWGQNMIFCHGGHLSTCN